MENRVRVLQHSRTFSIAGGTLFVAFLACLLVVRPWSSRAQDPEDTPQTTVDEFAGEYDSHSACMDQVLAAYARLGYDPGPDSAIAFQLETEMRGFQQGDVQEAESVADFIIAGGRLSIVGDGYEIHRDAETQMIVDRSMGTIRLYSNDEGLQAYGSESAAFLEAQQNMLRTCNVLECRADLTLNGEAVQKVVLSPDPTQRRLFNVLEAVVWLADSGTTLRRVDIVPFNTGTFSALSWSFYDVRVIARPDEFSEPVERTALSAGGRNSAQYSGMAVLDERKVN